MPSSVHSFGDYSSQQDTLLLFPERLESGLLLVILAHWIEAGFVFMHA